MARAVIAETTFAVTHSSVEEERHPLDSYHAHSLSIALADDVDRFPIAKLALDRSEVSLS